MKQARSETHYLWKIISMTHKIIGDIVTKVVIEVITYNTTNRQKGSKMKMDSECTEVIIIIIILIIIK